MAQVLVSEEHLSDIAQAIRVKKRSSDTYTPGQMGNAIRSIPTVYPTLIPKSITANGSYDPASDSADGYSSVAVNVPNSYSPSDEGKVVENAALVSQTSKNINANGTHDTTKNNSVVVNVPNSYSAGDEGKVVDNGALVAQTSKNINANGTHDTTKNNSVVVNVPNSYSAGDEGKVVSNGALVAQTSDTITENGTYDTTLNNSVTVDVAGGGSGSGSIDIVLNEQKYQTSGALSYSKTVRIPKSSRYFVAVTSYSDDAPTLKVNGVSQALSFSRSNYYCYYSTHEIVLRQNDVVEIAVNGTGNTAAFAQIIDLDYDGKEENASSQVIDNAIEMIVARNDGKFDENKGVYFDGSRAIFYDFGADNTDFTVYLVGKSIPTSGDKRILMSPYGNSTGNYCGLFRSGTNLWSTTYNNDDDLQVSANNVYVAAMSLDNTSKIVKWFVNGSKLNEESFLNSSRYVTLGGSSSWYETMYAYYFAVVPSAQSEEDILVNLAKINDYFIFGNPKVDNGKNILSGASVPSIGLGKNGDMYLQYDNANNKVSNTYCKLNGAWQEIDDVIGYAKVGATGNHVLLPINRTIIGKFYDYTDTLLLCDKNGNYIDVNWSNPFTISLAFTLDRVLTNTYNNLCGSITGTQKAPIISVKPNNANLALYISTNGSSWYDSNGLLFFDSNYAGLPLNTEISVTVTWDGTNIVLTADDGTIQSTKTYSLSSAPYYQAGNGYSLGCAFSISSYNAPGCSINTAKTFLYQNGYLWGKEPLESIDVDLISTDGNNVVPTYRAWHIWSKDTSGGTASMYIQAGKYDLINANPFTPTEDKTDILFAGSTYTEWQFGDLFKLASYADNTWNWAVIATKDLYSTLDGYKADDARVHTWYYSTAVDFYVLEYVEEEHAIYPPLEAYFNGDLGELFSNLVLQGTSYPDDLSQGVLIFMNTYAKDRYGTKQDGSSMVSSVTLTDEIVRSSLDSFKAQFGVLTQAEYSGYVTSAMISALGLVELGRDMESGSAITLSDSIENYSAILAQGAYYGQETSGYNTTMMYINPQLNTRYWAGMKDRNTSYDRYFTFTSDTQVSLSGGGSSRGIIIYGLL